MRRRLVACFGLILDLGSQPWHSRKASEKRRFLSIKAVNYRRAFHRHHPKLGSC